jgi:hypothetical protein
MRRGRALLIWGTVVLVLSLVTLAGAAWTFFASVQDQVKAIDTYPTVAVHGRPAGGEPVELRAGSYLVYGELDQGNVTLTGVEILGPGGAPVDVRSSRAGSLQRDGGSYRSVVSFDAVTAGRYTVIAVGEEGSSAVVGPSAGRVMLSIFGGMSRALAIACAGALLFLVGVGLLVGGAVVSTRSPQPRP